MQTDLRWKSVPYAAKGESSTIGSAGCGITCAAMVIASLKDESVTPVETAVWSLKNGYKALNQGTYYTYLIPQLKAYDIACERVNTTNVYKLSNAFAVEARQKITAALNDDKWVIACMGKGTWTSAGHYVLAWKVEGNEVLIKDPASTKPARIRNKISLWLNEIKYAWIIDTLIEGGDEVVEQRSVSINGEVVELPVIFKDGANYVSIRALCDALGLNVSSVGSTPIIAPGKVHVTAGGYDAVVDGANINGTTYGAIRQLMELTGHSVSWNAAKKAVIIE